jgi:TP901 family phage tail tape measure protein
MTDRQEVDVIVEADATAANNAIRTTSQELVQLIGVLEAFEVRLRQALSVDIPKGFEKIQRQFGEVKLPANMKSLTRAVAAIGQGTPEVALTNAQQRALANTVQADGVVRLIKTETELNKVLDARRVLYDRIRAAAPQNARASDLQKVYVNEVARAVGIAKADKERFEQLRRDEIANFQKFEDERAVIAKKALDQRARVEQADFERQAKRSARSIARIQDPEIRAQRRDLVVKRLQDLADTEGVRLNSAKLTAELDREIERHIATAVEQVAKPRPVKVGKSAMQLEQERLENLAARSAGKIAGLPEGERAVAVAKALEGLERYSGRFSPEGFTLEKGKLAAKLDDAIAQHLATVVDKLPKTAPKAQQILDDLKHDPAVQRLKLMKAEAGRDEALRKVLFERASALGGTAADTRRAYVSGAAQLYGVRPGDPNWREFVRGAMGDYKKFEDEVTAAKTKAVKERFDLEQKSLERFAKNAAGTIAKLPDAALRGVRREEVLNRLVGHGTAYGPSGFVPDRASLAAVLDKEINARMASFVPLPPKPPRTPTPVATKAPTPTMEERVQAGIQYSRMRQSAQGGAAQLGLQAGFLGNYALLGAGIGTAAYAASSTIQLEKELKNLQAIAQATDPAMDKLRSTIFEIGQTSKFSTAELAKSATTMAQAGYSASQIQMALGDIAKLAAASGSSLEDATNIVTSVLNIWNMSIERSGYVANALTEALNRSKLSMEQLSLGIQYAGNTAAQTGIEFEELVGAMSAAADAGIKSGSTIGTGVRSLLTELEEPNKKLQAVLTKLHLSASDVNPTLHGLEGALETLKTAGFTTADAMNTLEIRSASMFAALSGNLDKLHEVSEAVRDSHAANEAAAIQLNTFAARWTQLTNAVTQFTYTAGAPVLAVLGGFIKGLAAVVSGAARAGPAFQVIAIALASMGLASTVMWLTRLTIGFLGMTPATRILASGLALAALNIKDVGMSAAIAGGAVRGFTAAMITNPVFLMGAAITALTFALSGYDAVQASATAQVQKFKGEMDELAGKVKMYQDRVAEIDGYIKFLTNHHADLAGETNNVRTATENAIKKFGDWGLKIDDVGIHVDGLIVKLRQLSVEQAKQARDFLVLERSKATATRNAAESARDKAVQMTRGYAQSLLLLRGGALEEAGVDKKLVEVLAQGKTLAPADFRKLQDQLFKANHPAEGSGRKPLNAGLFRGIDARGLTQGLDQATIQANEVEAQDRHIDTLNEQLSQTDAVLSKAYQNVQGAADTIIHREKPQPGGTTAEKAAAALQGRTQAQQNYQELLKTVQSNVPDFLKTPGATEMLTAFANRRGIFVDPKAKNKVVDLNKAAEEYLLSRVEGGPEIAAAGGRQLADMPASTKEVLAKKYEAEAANEKDKKKRDELRKKAQGLKAEAAFDKAIANGEDPATAADNLGIAENTPLKPERGGGSKFDMAAKSRSTTFAKQADALQQQIESFVASFGPEAKDLQDPEKLKQLQAMLDQWKALKENAIRQQGKAEGIDAGQLQERLEAFRDKDVKAFLDKIVGGNLEAYHDLLALEAERTANRTTADAAQAVENGSMTLEQANKGVMTAWQDALKQALAASDAKFMREKHLTAEQVATAHEAVEARRKITNEYVDKAATDANTLLEAVLQRAINEEQVVRQRITRREGVLAALDNPINRGRVGEVQRERIVQRISDLNAADAARADYNRAVAEMEKRRGEMVEAQHKAATDTGSKEFAAQARETARAFQDAERAVAATKVRLDSLTAPAQEFQNASEAIAAAWASFREQASLNRPVLADVADGMRNVFAEAKEGLRSSIHDILSGQVSVEQGIMGMIHRILDAALDMLAEIAAKAAIQGIANAFGAGGTFSGITNAVLGAFGMGAPAAETADILSTAGEASGWMAAAQGMVPVRGYAQGTPAPFRDSVLAKVMPGEAILNKSAVDMIGEDHLSQVNAMGNRRLSAVTPMAAQQKREPDQVNVYVVAPNHKPQMTKRDVIAVISDDIQTGGMTKKLIKQVQVGGL